MSGEGQIEKIDLDKVDWRGSREFFESLGEALDKLDDKDESYDFTWVGKRKAIIEAGAPINKTLRPDVENSKNWDTTENLFIEGDNLDALKLLQESYLGKVKMIYIDPPYNTGKDFVYHDNFRTESTEWDENTEYKDESGNIQFKKNEKTNGRYHSDWLSMMYPRLKLARNLLTDDGVIFISIDDNEQANLKKLCDEIFGEDNFVCNICQKNRNGVSNDKVVSSNHNFILFYAKNYAIINENRDNFGISRTEDDFINYKKDDQDGLGCYTLNPVTGPGGARKGNPYYEILGVKNYWRYSLENMKRLIDCGKVIKVNNSLYQKTYKNDLLGKKKGATTWWDKVGVTSDGNSMLKELFNNAIFDFSKPVSLIEHILKYIPYKKDDLILDFFSGSATTAHAVMQLNAEDNGNRKWIMVQLPEVTDEKSEAFKAGYKTIPEISRERIRRAGDKIAAEHPDAKVDYGFRALKIADTNYKEVYKSASEYQQSLLLDAVDNIKDDRTELDLLFGVLTQSAFELNRPLETREIDGSNVYLYDYFGEISGLIACFASDISEETIKAIAKLKPLTAVFRDLSFADSQAKVNLSEHFRILSPETKVKVI